MEGSGMKEWYAEQTVLLTGATGFLGKGITEKLLRKTKVNRIYLLIRAKKGKDIQQRANELFQDVIFEKLSESVPNFKDRLSLVEGDVSLEGLGISEEDKKKLCEEVTTVIHGAATVRFDEKLKIAVNVNVRGTKHLLTLCKEIANLKAVVHISTAFSFCVNKELHEKHYPAPITGDNLLQLIECLNDTQLDAITSHIVDAWPNTYTFTKAVAEDTVRTYGKGLPIVIFRPAIVVGAMEEPVAGWTDNIYGPAGIAVAVASGIMRIIIVDEACVANIVPIDFCINALLASIKHAATKNSPEIPIFNFCSSKQNPITWGEYIQLGIKMGNDIPSQKAVWIHTINTTKNNLYYQLCALLYHILPALLIDMVSLARNKKPRALKIYNKVHKFGNVLSYFSMRSWLFHNNNIVSLLKDMSEEDKRDFNFDVSKLDWEKFMLNCLLGLREFIFKEKLDNLPAARRRMVWLKFLHYTVLTACYGTIIWISWKCLSIFVS